MGRRTRGGKKLLGGRQRRRFGGTRRRGGTKQCSSAMSMPRCGVPITCNSGACPDLISGALDRNLAINPIGIGSRIQSQYPQSSPTLISPMLTTIANQMSNISNIRGGARRSKSKCKSKSKSGCGCGSLFSGGGKRMRSRRKM